MKPNTQPFFTIPSYKPEQYETLLKSAADSKKLDKSWKEWHEKKETAKKEFVKRGINFVEIEVDVNELTEYCKKNNVANTNSTRTEFILNVANRKLK